MQKKYTVLGMHSAASSSRVEKAALSLNTVFYAKADRFRHTLFVLLSEEHTNDAPLYDAVLKTGCRLLPYGTRPLKPAFVSLKKATLSAVLFFAVLFLSFSPLSLKLSVFLQLTLTVLLLALNKRYLISGIGSLLSFHFGIPALIGSGVLSSFLLSFYNAGVLFFENHSFPIYFNSTSWILTVGVFGEYLKERQKKKTDSTVKKLLQDFPSEAVLFKNGKQISVPVSFPEPGDTVILRKEAPAPADLIIFEEYFDPPESRSSFSLRRFDSTTFSPILHAGERNPFQTVKCKVLKKAEDSYISRLCDKTEEAAAKKEHLNREIDRFVCIYLVFTIGMASVASCVKLFVTKDLLSAFRLFFTVPAVSCPASLALVPALSFAIAKENFKQAKILLKHPFSKKACAKIRTVFCDSSSAVLSNEKEKNLIQGLKNKGISCILWKNADNRSVDRHSYTEKMNAVFEERLAGKPTLVLGETDEDIPALFASDFGLAYSRSSDAVKEAADAILETEDLFAMANIPVLAEKERIRENRYCFWAALPYFAGTVWILGRFSPFVILFSSAFSFLFLLFTALFSLLLKRKSNQTDL